MSKTKRQAFEASDDFKQMINLLGILTDASHLLEKLQLRVNEQYLASVDKQKDEYARLQELMTNTETSLEVIARKHPEWFAAKQSIKTPFGTIAFRSSTKLQVDNEELTIVLIQQEFERQEKQVKDGAVPFNSVAGLLRHRFELDLEELEKLTDADLTHFRIKRVSNDNFSAKPAKVDMGKAVKEAVATEEAA